MAASTRFQQSEPFQPSKPGEPFSWLKAKYRNHKPSSKGKSSPGGNSKPKRNKLPSQPQRVVKMVLHMLPSGKTRFEVLEVIEAPKPGTVLKKATGK